MNKYYLQFINLSSLSNSERSIFVKLVNTDITEIELLLAFSEFVDWIEFIEFYTQWDINKIKLIVRNKDFSKKKRNSLFSL